MKLSLENRLLFIYYIDENMGLIFHLGRSLILVNLIVIVILNWIEIF
ncbi:hypothetical protein [Spiroplasma poulsonii]|nr:hypothetical protein [Spiroplasma poulsonii]UNF62745.1 hypothetical protein MNU24_08445 [Spiroplasma poulsonii]